MNALETREWLKIAAAGHMVPKTPRDALVEAGYLTVKTRTATSKTIDGEKFTWEAFTLTLTNAGNTYLGKESNE